MKASYSVAYVEIRRAGEGLVRGWAWAAWASETPPTRPWVTPIAFGVIEQVWKTPSWLFGEGLAEVAADEALRERFKGSNGIETRRVCGSFALAAYREHLGGPPNYRSPSSARVFLPNIGDRRPPLQPAAAFFTAYWRDVDETLRQNERAHSAILRNSCTPAMAELGLPPTATTTDVTRAFRRRALVTHPDRGGTAEKFCQLVALRDRALGEVKVAKP